MKGVIHRRTKETKSGEKGVVKAKKSADASDRWDFLEEIEAPMWADLTLESRLMEEDHDDEWFHRSHLFHQRSARKLRSAFAEGNDFQVPSSVSKSRGKDYKSRSWASHFHVSPDKGHPVTNLGTKALKLDVGSVQENKPKVDGGNSTMETCTGTSSSCDSSLTNSVSYCSHQVMRNDAARGGSVSSASSTIITESDQQGNVKVSDAYKETFGYRSGLLSSLRMNLRKSCAAKRSAFRIEVSNDSVSKEHKSSSKCSVGSSSNPRCKAGPEDVKVNENGRKSPMVNIGEDRKPRGRNSSSSGKSSSGLSNQVSKMPTLLKHNENDRKSLHRKIDKSKGSKGHKSPLSKLDVGSSNGGLVVKNTGPAEKQKKDKYSRSSNVVTDGTNSKVRASGVIETPVVRSSTAAGNRRCRDKGQMLNCQEAARTKVPLQTVHTKTSERVNLANRPSAATKANCKVRSSSYSRVASSGKENMTRRRKNTCQINEHKHSKPLVRGGGQTKAKMKVEDKCSRKMLVGSKGKGSEATDGKLRVSGAINLR